MRKNLRVAIVGATGLVGRKIIEVLGERKIDCDYFLFAHNNGVGKKFEINGKEYTVMALDIEKMKEYKLDYAFFAVSSDVSKMYMPHFVKNKVVVIDNSNAFRRKKNVPLIAANVNFEELKNAQYIIANPNCSTIQLACVLKPLDDKFKIKRVVVSTYQAISGAGQKGIDDYLNGTTEKFVYPINNNLFPHIDIFLPNGYTREEDKLIFESRKILNKPELNITATAVRVPILNCHSESVNIEFERKTSVKSLKNALKTQKNVILLDEPSKNAYPMPIIADNRDEVFVGRIRKDYSRPNCFNLWIVADNLRRGAASNAVDIFMEMENR